MNISSAKNLIRELILNYCCKYKTLKKNCSRSSKNSILDNSKMASNQDDNPTTSGKTTRSLTKRHKKVNRTTDDKYVCSKCGRFAKCPNLHFSDKYTENPIYIPSDQSFPNLKQTKQLTVRQKDLIFQSNQRELCYMYTNPERINIFYKDIEKLENIQKNKSKYVRPNLFELFKVNSKGGMESDSTKARNQN